MQISHEDAHNLIQLKADNAITANRQEMLDQHLSTCTECMAHAHEIESIENILRSTMQKHWNRSAPPLQFSVIKGKISFIQDAHRLLATRSLVASVVIIVLGFAVWQFRSPGSSLPNPIFLSVPPIPTPSLQLTNTQQKEMICESIQYHVRQGDTLESIARQFAISPQEIIDTNTLQAGSINEQTELTILLCDQTPIGTTHPPTFTITPFTETITYTPG